MLQAGTLYSIYQTHLQRAPTDTILIEHDRAVSLEEFDRLCARTADWLAGQGIVPGDHVGVWVVNRVEWLAILFGLARLGATLVAVNTRYRGHELQYILSNSQASMLILQLNLRKIDFADVLDQVDPASLPRLKKIAVIDADNDTPSHLLGKPVVAFEPVFAAAANVVHTGAAAQTTAPPIADSESLSASVADAPVVFFTTSGTTKGPKLVMHTQRNLSTHAGHVAQSFGFAAPGNVLLAALPLCGVFGLNSVLAAIAAGMPVVLMDIFDAHTASELLRKHHVTHIFGSDEMLRRLIEINTDDIPFPDLRLFGFAAFSPGLVELAENLIPRGFPIRGLYGSSEVNALFSLQRADLPIAQRALGGGTPAGGALASVRARDPDSGAICAPGVAGELEIHSPTRFTGYFNNPRATSDALTDDGFFKTGDLGYVRPDGSFVYQARMGDTMRLGGFLVDPSEIEEVLAELPEIASAQVVGIEIEGRLRPVAFAIPAIADPSADALLAQVASELAAFKVPVRLWFVQEFPATASANGLKFQRTRLRDMALENLRKEQAVKHTHV